MNLLHELSIRYSSYIEIAKDAHSKVNEGSSEIEAYWIGRADSCKECIRILQKEKKPCKAGIFARLGKMYHHYFNTKGDNKYRREYVHNLKIQQYSRFQPLYMLSKKILLCWCTVLLLPLFPLISEIIPGKDSPAFQ